MNISYFYTKTLGLKNKNIIQILAANSQIRIIQKGYILHNIGESCAELYFLEEGLVRGFLLDAKGNEVTDCFSFLKGTPIVSCLDLDGPSIISVEALEDSRLISIPLRIVLPLLKSDLELISLYNQLLRNSLKMHWENKNAIIKHTAAERYQWFLATYPGLINRVNHKYVASFLGITPVSLSRIRRAIREIEH
uniref:Crp/Fnr family transcriptional regulator n=1 Tax=uncultured Flavonifractor sp. TaxID=1193534 RepID=UPI00261FB8BC|nr:Crp/Fnr family transcriptional regulator [uncultured Flavonifractor sp.]